MFLKLPDVTDVEVKTVLHLFNTPGSNQIREFSHTIFDGIHRIGVENPITNGLLSIRPIVASVSAAHGDRVNPASRDVGASPCQIFDLQVDRGQVVQATDRAVEVAHGGEGDV